MRLMRTTPSKNYEYCPQLLRIYRKKKEPLL
nr:MAG TPA: hypothetical protein [Caudoviricetes sp.]